MKSLSWIVLFFSVQASAGEVFYCQTKSPQTGVPIEVRISSPRQVLVENPDGINGNELVVEAKLNGVLFSIGQTSINGPINFEPGNPEPTWMYVFDVVGVGLFEAHELHQNGQILNRRLTTPAGLAVCQ